MTRIAIHLEEDELKALAIYAKTEHRDLPQQASMIIREGLLQRGLLGTDKPICGNAYKVMSVVPSKIKVIAEFTDGCKYPVVMWEIRHSSQLEEGEIWEDTEAVGMIIAQGDASLIPVDVQGGFDQYLYGDEVVEDA